MHNKKKMLYFLEMKVIVSGDVTKAARKLSKLKSMSGTTSALVKQSLIFKKGTTIRREKILKKLATIRSFKMNQRNSSE